MKFIVKVIYWGALGVAWDESEQMTWEEAKEFLSWAKDLGGKAFEWIEPA